MAHNIRRLLLPLLFPSSGRAFAAAVLALCLAAASIVSPWPAFAATTTTTFTVQIQIVNMCVIVSTPNLNFGIVGVIGAAGVSTAGTIAVQCTTLAPYNIGLDAGIGTGATVANRLMTSGTKTVAYSLFSDPTFQQVWGNTIGTNTVASIGTGASQAFTVFGHAPAQATPGAGIYNDVITVTATF
jgi:spore coat protein U-like protein